MPGILKFQLDRLLFRNLVNGVTEFQALSKSQSDWRLAHKYHVQTRDLFSGLIDARDTENGNGLKKDEIVAEAGALLLAGSDTQGTTLAAALFYCLNYPSSLLDLQHEIRTTFTSVEDIRIGTALSSCRYLRACIDEALRLSPPIGGLLPREILAGGLTIEENYFPVGTDIGVPHYAIHHNDVYYPEPFMFRPERWIEDSSFTVKLGGSSNSALAIAQSAFCAFGVGRTSCVGRSLAYQEMSIILARIVWLYEIRLQIGSTLGGGRPGLGRYRERKEEFQTWDGFFSTHQGPLVEFKLRS